MTCKCPNCHTILEGGLIWETGREFAILGKHHSQNGRPAATVEEAEALADTYAEAYGATRTRGRWGRQCVHKNGSRTFLSCVYCKHEWSPGNDPA